MPSRSVTAMPSRYDTFELQRLRMFVYLIPVVGFFPAAWSLYRKQGDRREQIVSRLAVTLALGWLVGYLLLNGSAQLSDTNALPLMIASATLTSGYFVTTFLLMMRLWQRKSLWLPGVSDLGDRLP